MSEPEPRKSRRSRARSTDYTRLAVEWVLVVGFAGLVLAILGIAAAAVYWAWSS